MTTNASRAPIDLDALARELHTSSSPQPGSSAPATAAKGDPLAELARIVGQDDPFRALLAARGVSFRGDQARVEPTFADAAPAPREEAAPPQPTPADAFDQYLASIEQSHQADQPNGAYQDPAAFESDDRDYSNAAVARPRGRGRLVQVGAGLGLLAFCVTGAFAYKGLFGGSRGGEPVTVLADRTPLKVAPEKADGVDIPDQNKQIYERNATDGQIKVVNREEQPLDVAQAARAASAKDGGQGGVTPGGGLLTESLGEPHRIRTVAVKPDAPPPAMQQQREAQQAEAQSDPVSPIPTMTMPGASSESTPAAAAQKRSPRTQASTKPAATPAAEPSDVAQAAPSPAPATPAPRKAIQRVASVAPETTATIEPDAPAAPAPAVAASSGGGGFAVQLGVRNSEADARAAFRQMQGKYTQLAGKPELIRQAEVNGKSLYRVRVGPLGKSEANSLCTSLKGAGGQCFVAAN